MMRPRRVPGGAASVVSRSDATAGGAPIMGIDASLRSTGVGVIAVDGHRARMLAGARLRNAPQRTLSECLLHLAEGIRRVILDAQPRSAAVEGVFVCRNARSALLLGHARGVAIACCAQAGIPVYEYEPRRVKQAVVGYGGAQKMQVQKMIMHMLGLTEIPQEDVADALAVAICHWHAQSRPLGLHTGTV